LSRFRASYKLAALALTAFLLLTVWPSVPRAAAEVIAPQVTCSVNTLSVTASSALLSGNIVDAGGTGCDKRQFYYRVAGSSGWTATKAETGSFGPGVFSYNLTGLAANKTYEFKALAHNSVGWGESAAVRFKTALSSPRITAPGNGKTLLLGNIAVKWGKVSGAAGYQYSVSDVSVKPNKVIVNKSYTTKTSFTLSGKKLISGHRYQITVTSCLGTKPSGTAAAVTVKVQNKALMDQDYLNRVDAKSSTKYYVMISLKDHVVDVFKGSNHHWTILKRWSCSTGKKSTPTLKGHFKVGNKGQRFYVNRTVYCNYYTQIKGNYLMHSVLKAHGRVYDGRLGVSIFTKLCPGIQPSGSGEAVFHLR
jgi:hypothetical protein